MSGLDTTIVEHKLPLIPNAVSVWQQLRRMKPEVALKIKEVEKQWNASFLVVAEYPQWVANIVLVPKKDEKVRMPIISIKDRGYIACISWGNYPMVGGRDDTSFPCVTDSLPRLRVP
ncbi:hypothetical protein CR513_62169, partial [Mucuna pruriens]